MSLEYEPSSEPLPDGAVRWWQNPLTLRIELTSENDLFFHFNHNLDEHGFRQVHPLFCITLQPGVE